MGKGGGIVEESQVQEDERMLERKLHAEQFSAGQKDKSGLSGKH